MPQGQEETKKIIQEFKDDIRKGKADILNEVRISKAEIEEVITDLLPKDHEQSHDDIRKFMEHSPEPKIHGDHHDFTESVRIRLEHLIIAIFKGIGGIILISLVIGLYAWVKHQAGIIN